MRSFLLPARGPRGGRRGGRGGGCADLHGQGQARELGVGGPGVAIEGQRHQARRAFDQGQAELLGQAVAEVGGADLGDGQAARGDDQAGRLHGAPAGLQAVLAVRVRHGIDLAGLPALHAAGLAFGQQHGDDVFGRAVGKQLALVLFMVGDAVPVHERNEVGRRVARQGRAAELRIAAHEVLVGRAHVQVAVGEVAAATARDADLLCHLLRVVQEQHRQATLSGLGRAEQTGRAGADDDGVEREGRGHKNVTRGAKGRPFSRNGAFS